MKYLIIIGLFVFCCISRLKAQSDFKEGYIVKNNNDTIYGLINYKGDIVSVKKCIFLKDFKAEKQVFSPKEIKGYRFTNGKYYISKSVKVKNETKQLFLEYLIKGIVDVFYYRDDQGNHYLISDKKGDIYELENIKREVIINNTTHFKDSKKYIGILKYAFSESPSISKRVEKIRLNHESLIDIAYDYHNEVCSDGECKVYKRILPKKEKKYGIIVGLNGISISEVDKGLEELDYLEGKQFDFKVYPSIGMFYKLNLPSLNERLYFQYEITYSRVDLTISESYLDKMYNRTHQTNVDYTYNAINNSVLCKYEFPKKKFKPTFQIGGFIDYFFGAEYNGSYEVKLSSGTIFNSYQTDESPFENYDLGILCGIGLKTEYKEGKELFFDFRYKRGLGQLHGLNSNILSLVFGMQIGK